MNREDIEDIVYSNAEIIGSEALLYKNNIDTYFHEVDKEVLAIYINDDLENLEDKLNVETLEFKIKQIKTLDQLVDWIAEKIKGD